MSRNTNNRGVLLDFMLTIKSKVTIELEIKVLIKRYFEINLNKIDNISIVSVNINQFEFYLFFIKISKMADIRTILSKHFEPIFKAYDKDNNQTL